MAVEPRYWVLSECILKRMLERAAKGETPELLLIELYANSDSEHVEGEG